MTIGQSLVSNSYILLFIWTLTHMSLKLYSSQEVKDMFDQTIRNHWVQSTELQCRRHSSSRRQPETWNQAFLICSHTQGLTHSRGSAIYYVEQNIKEESSDPPQGWIISYRTQKVDFLFYSLFYFRLPKWIWYHSLMNTPQSLDFWGYVSLIYPSIVACQDFIF